MFFGQFLKPVGRVADGGGQWQTAQGVGPQFSINYGGGQVFSRWDSPTGNINTGTVDMNYVKSDGSGETRRINGQNTEGIEMIPSFRGGPGSWWNYVPEAVSVE